MQESDEDLKRSYWSASYHDEWYSGNNPGKQKRLSEGAGELRRKMRARGLDTTEIDQAVRDGKMPPFGN